MMSERRNSESNQAVDTPLNIEALVNCLAAQPDVLAAYLFGSYATDKARPESDVDVAVLLSGTDEMERFQRCLWLMGKVEEALGRRPADVVVLNDAPPLLAYQVLRYGRLIFERDRAARVEFEVRAGKIYADLQPTYEYHSHDLFQKIREAGLSGRRRNRQQPARSNYARIDDARVYGILKRHLGDFDAFARAIVDYLQPQTSTGQSESEQR